MKILVFIIFCTICFSEVYAQESVSANSQAELMRQNMRQYFAAEKNESLFFMGAGVLSLLGGGYLLTKDSFSRGISYPVMAIGLIQLTVGSIVYFKTDSQLANLEEKTVSDPTYLRTVELPRMKTVNYWFDVYKIIEISLLAGGITTAIIGHQRENNTLKGVGTGLAAQSAIMLVLDFFAESRADKYTEQLENFTVAFAPTFDSGLIMAAVFRL